MAQNYVLLERIELAASAASVTFSNIPQSGYTDLKIVYSSRGTGSYGYANVKVSFNGAPTGTAYSGKVLAGYSTGVLSQNSSSADSFIFTYSDGASSTSNVFASGELYIPNYLSSNYKSISADSVSENNSGSAYAATQGLGAGLWSSTAAINRVDLTPYDGDSFVAGSTFAIYGLAAVGTTPAIAPKALGGNIQTDGTYWYHTFLASGTFTPATALSCDYLVVAGGAGGGGWQGGGGGAGGLRSTVTATGGGGSLESKLSTTANTGYTVTIGAGGTGGPYAIPSIGTNGNNSVFGSITSIGGGTGGGYNASTVATNGFAGGSGGGAGGANATTTGGAGTANQGYAGGNGNASAYATGGGGGAGVVGGNASGSGNGGAGGNGVALSAFSTTTGTGVSTYYAGGGGGHGATVGGAGGAGGGGAGPTGNGAGGAGTTNTGSAGGGGRDAVGGNGGSGLVIIRYAV